MTKLAYGTAWTIGVGAIAALAMEPALAEPLTPLPEGDPAMIDSTSAAALLTEPEIERVSSESKSEPNTAVTPSTASQSAPAAIVVPYAGVATVIAAPTPTDPPTPEPKAMGETRSEVEHAPTPLLPHSPAPASSTHPARVTPTAVVMTGNYVVALMRNHL